MRGRRGFAGVVLGLAAAWLAARAMARPLSPWAPLDPAVELAASGAPPVGPAAAARATARLPGPATAPARDLAELRRRILALVAAFRVTGAAVTVIEDGQPVWMSGLGLTGRPDGAAVDADTLFRVGSLSKSFLSVAMMRLAERGRLDLDAPVRALAPELAIDDPWEATHPVRLAHLLEHSAGFDEFRFNEIFPADGREDHTLGAVLAVNPRSRRVRWPAGTRFAYSQPGYTVAAYLMEKITGRPFEEVVADEVFAPLGLDAPAYRLTPDAAARLAVGHVRGKAQPYRPLLHRPAGGLLASLRQVTRLTQLLLGRGAVDGRRVLDAASVDRVERSGTLEHGLPLVAYGLGNWGDVSNRVPLRGHGGFVPGYLGLFRYGTSISGGCVVLLNESGVPFVADRIADEIFDYLLRDRAPVVPPPVELPPDALAAFAGYYDFASPNIEFLRFRSDVEPGLTVSVDGNSLLVAFGGRFRARLSPTGAKTFRFPGDVGGSVAFLRGDDGRRTVSFGGTLFVEGDARRAAARSWAWDLAVLLLLSVFGVAPAVLAHRRDHPVEAAIARSLLVAAASLILAVVAFDVSAGQGALGTVNAATVAVWACTWIFACAALVALRQALATLRRPLVLPLKVHGLLAALACVGLALFLSRYGLLGLRTWAW